MNNRHLYFWLTIGSMFTGSLVFIFILFMCIKEQIQFHKQYCLLLIPILVYLIIQFIINYDKLTDEYENK